LSCVLFVHVVLRVSYVRVSSARGGALALAPTLPRANRVTVVHHSQVALYMLKTCADIELFLFGCKEAGRRNDEKKLDGTMCGK